MISLLRKAALAVLLVGTCSLAAQEGVFGGIELASSSVKGLTFTFQPGADPPTPAPPA